MGTCHDFSTGLEATNQKKIQTWNTTNGKQGCKRLRSANNYGKKAWFEWFEWFAAKNEGLFVGQVIFGIPTI